MTTTTPAPCWADPLTRGERRKVAGFLSRACGRFYRAALEANTGEAPRYARLSSSMEMPDLHLDVTERAEVAAR